MSTLQDQKKRSCDSHQGLTRLRPSHPAKRGIVKKGAQYVSSEGKLSAFQLRLEPSLPPMPTMNLDKKILRRQTPHVTKRRFIDPQPGATRASPFNTSDELRSTPPEKAQRKRKFRELQPRATSLNPFDSNERRESHSDDIRGRKKQRFIDPQPGATRVSPFNTSDELRETPPDGIRKRQRRFQRPPIHDGQPTELALPESPRLPKNAELPKKPKKTLVRKSKKVSVSGDEKAELKQLDASAGPNVVTRNRASAAASSSRVATIPDGQAAGKKKQRRKFWTCAAEDLLVEKIGEMGCRWSAIRDRNSCGNHFQGRTNVQLKDKARNIKFQILKAGKCLPENFHDVTISKKQLTELRRMGIDPEDDGDG
ncbi:hypothetical protein RUND412_009900 [Rhizina undulata]